MAEVGNGRMGEREKRRRGGGEQGRRRQGEKEKTGKYEKGISSKCEKWRRKDWEKEKAKQKEREQDNVKDERKEKGLCVGQVRAVVSHAPTTDTCFSKVVLCAFLHWLFVKRKYMSASIFAFPAEKHSAQKACSEFGAELAVFSQPNVRHFATNRLSARR